MTTGWELFGFPFLLNLFSFYPFLIVRFWKFIHLLTHCWCFSGVNCYWSFVMREVYYSFYLTKGPHPLKVTDRELILHSYSLEKKRVITFSWVFTTEQNLSLWWWPVGHCASLCSTWSVLGSGKTQMGCEWPHQARQTD